VNLGKKIDLKQINPWQTAARLHEYDIKNFKLKRMEMEKISILPMSEL
jgi:hypothetical protein